MKRVFYQSRASICPVCYQVLAEVIEKFRDVVNKLWASGKDDSETMKGLSALRYAIETLFPGQENPQEDLATRSRALVKVILIHSYMDGLNFDVGRAKMCISRTMLPDGRLMPTCAYNVVHGRLMIWTNLRTS